MEPAYHVPQSKKPENPAVVVGVSTSLFDHFHFIRRVGLFAISTEKPFRQRLCK